jgi:hypothetical protein
VDSWTLKTRYVRTTKLYYPPSSPIPISFPCPSLDLPPSRRPTVYPKSIYICSRAQRIPNGSSRHSWLLSLSVLAVKKSLDSSSLFLSPPSPVPKSHPMAYIEKSDAMEETVGVQGLRTMRRAANMGRKATLMLAATSLGIIYGVGDSLLSIGAMTDAMRRPGYWHLSPLCVLLRV